MTEKLNIDNGLRGQMKEHQAVTQNKNNCLTKYPLTQKLKGGQCVSVLGTLATRQEKKDVGNYGKRNHVRYILFRR